MDCMTPKKMRREDHTQYIDSNRQEVSFLQDRLVGYFKKGLAFVKRLVTCQMQANFQSVTRPKTFYNRMQKYRPVPRQPHPPELLVELERVRKGFDPLHMTVSRYQKEEKERLKARRDIVEEAKLRRDSENQAPTESKEPRKIFKMVMSLEEKEENRKERWELCEKKFALVLDTLKELGEAALNKPNQTNFFDTAKTQKEEKPLTNNSVPKPEVPLGHQSAPLPTIPEDSVENASDQSTLEADKTEQTSVSQVSIHNNPFRSSITKAKGMNDLIKENDNTKNDPNNIIASIFSFGSQNNNNNQQSNCSQQQTFPPSFQQANNNSNMNSGPNQFSQSNHSEPSYNQQNQRNQQNQQNRSIFNTGQPNYSTAVHFPPNPSTNNLFSSGISNPNIAKNNPADYFRPSNNSNTKTVSSLFETSSNRTQKKEKGYRHKKGTQLRVQ